jgi:hypothetical protein
VGGLVTEASPLTFPENASIDEANFELDRDGTRSRRLGMDYEEDLTPYSITYNTDPSFDPKVVTYEWSDVAGLPDKSFIVCQVHDKAYVIDRADDTLKSQSWVKHSVNLTTNSGSTPYASFAGIDGFLVIGYGEAEIKIVEYNSITDTFSEETSRLKTRDLFGVEDLYDNGGTTIDLLSPEYINFRPQADGVDLDEHIYNLRNQGWAVPRADWDAGTNPLKEDPITEFENDGSTYRGLPSNSDSPIANLYPNTAKTDKDTERFNEDGAFNLEPSKSRAATGHFIIDVLERGDSRQAEIARLNEIYANANPSEVDPSVTFRTSTVSLPQDKTNGGAKSIAEFAGRVFYAGFSSENIGGDSQSPNLASYVFFSQLVKDRSQITRCFQEGDPTGAEEPDLLDTDGGFVRLAGAYNIQSMVDVGSALMVFAENGVWAISGSDNGTFTANNQTTGKVSEHGTLAPQSVVLVDGTVMYWSDDAIYHVARDQFGTWGAKELSVNIRDLYQNIDSSDKAVAQGIFDSYSKKVRWMYSTRTQSTDSPRELVFDLILAAFYPATIGQIGSTGPKPIAPIQVSPFNLVTQDLEVAVLEDSDVLSDTEDVVVATEVTSSGFLETAYITLINQGAPSLTQMTFSTYRNTSFLDWFSVDGTGVDSPAFLLTGYIGNGDFHRQKQVPYIYFHLLRTETGFVDSGDDLTPLNESSCLVQSQWDWSNSESYGKWGRQFQAYRYRRHYTPEDVSDTYDYGTKTIVTKNKLRGRGRVVSLLISTEPGKDLKLLGWSMNIGMNSNG